jgi:hypothetical protein
MTRPDYSEEPVEFYKWAIKPVDPPPPFLPPGHTYETDAEGEWSHHFTSDLSTLDDCFPKRLSLFGNLEDNYAILEMLKQREIIRGADNTEHTHEGEMVVLFESQAAGLEFLARLNKYLKEKTQKLREAYDF